MTEDGRTLSIDNISLIDDNRIMEPIESVLARKPLSDAAKRQLVEQFTPFCHSMVRKLQRIQLSQSYGDGDDWFQEAQIALLEAGEMFDPGRKCKFITYATTHVFGKLRQKMRFHNGLIHVPSQMLLPGNGDVIGKLRPVSLVYQDGSEENIGVPTYDEPKDNIDLYDAMQKLLSGERWIIEQRFGLNGQKKLRLEDVGEQLGVTRSRVQQIEAAAREKLKILMSR